MFAKLRIDLIVSSLLLVSLGCKPKKSGEKFILDEPEQSSKTAIKYAKGFTIEKNGDLTVITVTNPWPKAEKTYSYALIPKEKLQNNTPSKDAYDAIITTPINKLVVTSTTHIPALEALGQLDRLVGFPDTEYISSKTARKLITEGKIRELGNNESLNTEVTLELNPDVIVGFAVNGQTNPYEVLQKANIQIVLNGDWTEETPLGKAEWLKFFGALLDQEHQADSIFNTIESNYNRVKSLAAKAQSKPSVISGALYKDVWYAPAGDSWAAQFLEDSHTSYIFGNVEGTGSLSLSFESVFEKAQNTEFWVSPGQFTSYTEMLAANVHYGQFNAFVRKRVYTFSATKGETGGLLYYELAPHRPDWVLEDLVHIFHPTLLPEHQPHFFTPLKK